MVYLLIQQSLKKLLRLLSVNTFLSRRKPHWFRFSCWVALTVLLVSAVDPAIAQQFSQKDITSKTSINQEIRWVEAGQAAYQAGRYADALQSWKSAATQYRRSEEVLNHTIALNGIALSQIQLAEYTSAENTLAQALSILQSLSTSQAQQRILAQTFSAQGQLMAARGQYRIAAQKLEVADQIYQTLGKDQDVIRNRLNQGELLRLSGLYQRSMEKLESVNQLLVKQPDSSLKSTALRQLGNLYYQLSGESNDGLCFDSTDCLHHSLEIAKKIQSHSEQALTLISKGNNITSKESKLEFYQQAANLDVLPTLRLQAHINIIQQLAQHASDGSGVKTETATQALTTWSRQAQKDFQWELSQIQTLLEAIPPSRYKLRLQASMASSLLRVPDSIAPLINLQTENFFQKLLAQATELEDQQFVSYALGYLGEFYEKKALQATSKASKRQYISQAEKFTQAATELSERLNLVSITYQWLWQQGRITKIKLSLLPLDSTVEEKNKLLVEAISAYEGAVNHLNLLRGDLVSINRHNRASFRQKIKPIYQDYIELLISADSQNLSFNETRLSSAVGKSSTNISSYLERAIQTADSLQVAELTNFFRSDCLLASEIQLEKIDSKAAIIYPIVFDDHLEVILGMPQATYQSRSEGQKSNKKVSRNNNVWQHKKVDFNLSQLNASVSELGQLISARGSACKDDGAENVEQGQEKSCERAGVRIVFPEERQYSSDKARERITALGETLYEALISPFEAELEASNVETLIFMSSGPLQNIPMAVLRNGETGKYLIEQYAIATSPSLQLLDSKPFEQKNLRAVLGGLTDSSLTDFPQLKYAGEEIKRISAQLPGSQTMLGTAFTQDNLKRKVSDLSFPIVHLATHGKFGSTLEKTFIVTEDGKVNANELSILLQGKGLGRDQPIELLVLSACETARGDDLAALGLSGIAVRSGARTTLGSLWQVDDEATATLMTKFYEQLSKPGMTRARALQQAQLSVLHDQSSKKREPYYWAAFVLVGSWL